MEQLICKGCGGVLKKTEDPEIFECEFCRSKYQTKRERDSDKVILVKLEDIKSDIKDIKEYIKERTYWQKVKIDFAQINNIVEKIFPTLLFIGIIFAILTLIALLSFNRLDLSFYTSHPNIPPKNILGILGAYVGGALFFIFGKIAYLIPIFILFHAYYKLRGKNLPEPTRFIITTIILLISMRSLFLDNQPQVFALIGVVGLCLKQFFLGYVGRIGTFLIILVIFSISLFSYVKNK